MKLPKRPAGIPGKVIRELLLQSGQFALFYLLMMVSRSGSGFLFENDNVLLLAALLVQSIILAIFGHIPFARFSGSLVTPAVYTIIASRSGPGFALDALHVGFWAYSLFAAVFQTIPAVFKNRMLGFIMDFFTTLINATSFLFLYFYFDVVRTIDDMVRAGTGGTVVPADELRITAITAWLPVFLSDQEYGYIILVLGVFALAVAVARADVRHSSHRIHDLFGSYADSEKRDAIMKTGKARTEFAELCIMFADIRGFGAISDVNEPQAVTEMLNAWFGNWAKSIEKHGGFVDKYVGDEIMAVFGLVNKRSRKKTGKVVPAPCDEAVATILEMRESFKELQLDLVESGFPFPKDFGTGIHFGRAMTGIIGGGSRKDFTVIGDVVNGAALLESTSDKLKTTCVISEDVFSRLRPDNQEHFKPLARIRFKSKSEPTRVYGLKEKGGKLDAPA